MDHRYYKVLRQLPLTVGGECRGVLLDIGHVAIISGGGVMGEERRTEPRYVILNTSSSDGVNRLTDATGLMPVPYQTEWSADVPLQRVIDYVNELLPHEV